MTIDESVKNKGIKWFEELLPGTIFKRPSDYGCVGAKFFDEDDLNTNVSQDELEEFYELFPHRAGEFPGVIVYNQIW